MDISPEVWNYIKICLIPFTYGFVGWVTNWVALKMTFYPLEFWGIRPFLGWQGIIPRKAHKMASKSVDVITERLMNVEEVFSRVDPAEVEKRLMPNIEPAIREATEDFGRSMNAEIWEALPEFIKNEIYHKVDRSSRETIRKVIQDLKGNIASILDVKGIVLHCFTGANVGLIVDVFQSVGKPEFRFIERSGFYFGFLLGLVQMVFWIYFPMDWTLPMQGVIVGYLTNYLAINMIFRPLHPKVYLGVFHYQGLFMKRQSEVSKEYAKIVAEKVLTPSNVMRDILNGKASSDVMDSIQKAVIEQMDRMTTIARPIMYSAGVYKKYETLKYKIADKMLQTVLDSSDHLEDYLSEALNLEATMGEKMSQLPPKEFETILRAAFQEDEWLLIFVGAMLGALVGTMQMLIL